MDAGTTGLDNFPLSADIPGRSRMIGSNCSRPAHTLLRNQEEKTPLETPVDGSEFLMLVFL
jgi:hypothetical protein